MKRSEMRSLFDKKLDEMTKKVVETSSAMTTAHSERNQMMLVRDRLIIENATLKEQVENSFDSLTKATTRIKTLEDGTAFAALKKEHEETIGILKRGEEHVANLMEENAKLEKRLAQIEQVAATT